MHPKLRDTKCVKKKNPSIHRKYFQSLNLQKLEWTFVYNDHLATICKIYENMNDYINNSDRKVEWRKFLYMCLWRQTVPLHQASPLLLWFGFLSHLRVPTILAVKSTLVLYASHILLYILSTTRQSRGQQTAAHRVNQAASFVNKVLWFLKFIYLF